MTPKPRAKTHPHGKIPAATSIHTFQTSVKTVLTHGRPGGTQATHPQAQPTPPVTPHGPHLPGPPNHGDVRITTESANHILNGDGGKQGGHVAGTGLANKNEFPVTWGRIKILDAAHQVAQNGKIARGPTPNHDKAGNVRWAYEYVGEVDGVKIKVHVLSDGEIVSAYPIDAHDPGVIHNPKSPVVPGTPPHTTPRFSNDAVGGDRTFTWEGPKNGKYVRITTDEFGGHRQEVTLGTYQGKWNGNFTPTPKK
ncbi:MAG: hypothetical protein QOF58_4156 [Pseudonocardiales bacterium]|jgi:hypothetical protein|nr:hypothetical protein [Pseudonocardiales bacterium]